VARWLAGCIVPGVAVLCVKEVERGCASEVVGWGHGKVKVGHITSPRSELSLSIYCGKTGAVCARMCNIIR
jgi:hypothetical protein